MAKQLRKLCATDVACDYSIRESMATKAAIAVDAPHAPLAMIVIAVVSGVSGAGVWPVGDFAGATVVVVSGCSWVDGGGVAAAVVSCASVTAGASVGGADEFALSTNCLLLTEKRSARSAFRRFGSPPTM